MHRAMIELPWGSPEAVRRMTPLELYCLASDRPPGAPRAIGSFEEYREFAGGDGE